MKINELTFVSLLHRVAVYLLPYAIGFGIAFFLEWRAF